MTFYEDNKRQQETIHNLKNLEINEVTISSFETIVAIGNGISGRVFLTNCLLNSEIYAMKKMQKDYIIYTEQKELIENEKNILIRLNHPFIVHVCLILSNSYIGRFKIANLSTCSSSIFLEGNCILL